MFYTDPPSIRHSAFCGPTAVLQLAARRRRRAASDGMGGYGSLGRKSWERRRSTPSVAESYMTKKMFRRRSDQQPLGVKGHLWLSLIESRRRVSSNTLQIRTEHWYIYSAQEKIYTPNIPNSRAARGGVGAIAGML